MELAMVSINIWNRIQEICIQTPSAPALTYENNTLSYAHLHQAITKLATKLVEANGGNNLKGQRVCVIVERHHGLVIALLAVWKAGGCYVPVDPHYPEERKRYIFNDCQAQFLLIDEKQRESKTSDFNPTSTTLVINDVGELVELTTCDSIINNADSDSTYSTDLAYIIYTSGSTGKPKGVMVEHRTVLKTLIAFMEVLKMGPGHSLLAVTTFCFDISVLELFLPLLCGAHLEVASRRAQNHGEQLKQLLQTRTTATTKCPVTHLQATPATFKMLMTHGWQGDPDLTLLCGGEAFQTGLLTLLPKVKDMFNVYGPTEATIWSAFYKFPKCQSIDAIVKDIPIGTPLQHISFYVLNSNMNPVPDGEVGQLFISGDCLATGYWQRPELTSEKFFTHGNIRIYDTGDLVKKLADGNIVFVARVDEQIKLRGYRIEIGEVTNTLESHNKIETAVVTVLENSEDFAGESVLIAYIKIAKDNDSFSGLKRELRKYMLKQLPSYMVPADFRIVRTFPVTPNGKIDKKALNLFYDTEHDEFTIEMESNDHHDHHNHRDLHDIESDVDKACSKICLLVEEMTGATVNRDNNLQVVGLDSLGAVMFLKKLNGSFHVQLTLKQLLQLQSITELGFLVVNKAKEEHRVREEKGLSSSSSNKPTRNFTVLNAFRGFFVLMVCFEHYNESEVMPYGKFSSGGIYFSTVGLMMISGLTAILKFEQQQQQQQQQQLQITTKQWKHAVKFYLQFYFSQFLAFFPVLWLVFILTVFPYSVQMGHFAVPNKPPGRSDGAEFVITMLGLTFFFQEINIYWFVSLLWILSWFTPLLHFVVSGPGRFLREKVSAKTSMVIDLVYSIILFFVITLSAYGYQAVQFANMANFNLSGYMYISHSFWYALGLVLGQMLLSLERFNWDEIGKSVYPIAWYQKNYLFRSLVALIIFGGFVSFTFYPFFRVAAYPGIPIYKIPSNAMDGNIVTWLQMLFFCMSLMLLYGTQSSLITAFFFNNEIMQNIGKVSLEIYLMHVTICVVGNPLSSNMLPTPGLRNLYAQVHFQPKFTDLLINVPHVAVIQIVYTIWVYAAAWFVNHYFTNGLMNFITPPMKKYHNMLWIWVLNLNTKESNGVHNDEEDDGDDGDDNDDDDERTPLLLSDH